MRCIKPRDRKHITKTILAVALMLALARALALFFCSCSCFCSCACSCACSCYCSCIALALVLVLALAIALVLARGVISPLIHIEGSSALFSREVPVTSQVHLQRGWSTLSFDTYMIEDALPPSLGLSLCIHIHEGNQPSC